MRVLVCGGRDYSDYDAMKRELDALASALDTHEILTVIEGGARGADRLAALWCDKSRCVRHVQVKADWETHGKSAGPIRNQKMLEQQPDLVLAFPGEKGTADMMDRARKAGIEVREVR